VTKLPKGLLFTDIHFGKKQNSDAHNQQCIDFINFVCNSITSHKIDHIIFLAEFLAKNGVKVLLHAFLDGRDVAQKSAPSSHRAAGHHIGA
jgi:bisphosphoglycerate-independent phosphoglycerate mutase (AlkP superfamily)